MTAMADQSVLIVGNFLSGHVGVRGVCEELADRLKNVGWSVITTSDRASKAARMADMVRTAWARRKQYSVAQVDLFSGPAFLWGEAVCHTLRAAGKPYVVTLHGGSLPEFAAAHESRCRRLLERAAAVTAPSNFLREAMRRFRGDIEVLPNALEIGNYPFRHRQQASPNIVWVRAFDSIYNPVLAVRALDLVVRRHPEARLVMVGPDKGDGSLGVTQAEAARLGLADRIEFTGRVPKRELAAAIHRGDIFINTTNIDNAPVTVLEAMACGACVVSTNVGGIPYMVQHGENGLLVPPDNAEAMAGAIGRILEEPELAARLSRNGRNTTEQIDWPRILTRWVDLLSSHARG